MGGLRGNWGWVAVAVVFQWILRTFAEDAAIDHARTWVDSNMPWLGPASIWTISRYNDFTGPPGAVLIIVVLIWSRPKLQSALMGHSPWAKPLRADAAFVSLAYGADGASTSLSVHGPTNGDPRTSVDANANVKGRLIAEQDITLDKIYVEFSERGRWLPFTRTPIIRAFPRNIGGSLRQPGNGLVSKMQAGDTLPLHQGDVPLLFSEINVSPLNPVRHKRHEAHLVVELLYPQQRIQLDIPDHGALGGPKGRLSGNIAQAKARLNW